MLKRCLALILFLQGFILYSNETTTHSTEKQKEIETCSQRRGLTLFKETGKAWHPLRVPRELTPAQWKTELLTHRCVLPLTAGEFCSLADYLGKSHSAFEEEAEEVHTSDPTIQDLIARQEELEELVNKPSEESLALSNLLIKGSTSTTLIVPANGNTSFGTKLTPRFLWRYGERFLYQTKLRFTLDDCDTDIDLLYTTVNFIINDYFTFRAGKNTLPLGFVWEKMTPEWINKLPNLPLPYVGRPLTPASDIGVEVRGAIPVGPSRFTSFSPPVIHYHAWVGNGPGQSNDDVQLNCNFHDNNQNKGFGAKIGFRIVPFKIALSGMRARWNNNEHGGTVITTHSLYYNALVLENDWQLSRYLRFLGEFIWTQRDAVKNVAIGIPSSSITELGYWGQLSLSLAFLREKHLKNFETVIRFSGVSSDLIEADRHQWSLGLNYYISDRFIAKTSYDFNSGVTNPSNRFNLQFAYGF